MTAIAAWCTSENVAPGGGGDAGLLRLEHRLVRPSAGRR